MIVFFFDYASNLSEFNNVIENLLSGFIGAVVGAGISFLTAWWMKNREIKSISLTNAKYTASLLMKERASLEQINFVIKKVKNEGAAQQVPIRELFLGIKQENLEKILTYKKFYKKRFFIQCEKMIQKIISAEQTYRDCYELIGLYNQAVKNYLFATGDGNKRQTIDIVEGFLNGSTSDNQLHELNSNFEALESKYNEAVKLNEEVRKTLDELCTNIFGDEYRPVPTDGIVPSMEA